MAAKKAQRKPAPPVKSKEEAEAPQARTRSGLQGLLDLLDTLGGKVKKTDAEREAQAPDGFYWCPGCQAYHPNSERDETDRSSKTDRRDPNIAAAVEKLGLSTDEYDKAVGLSLQLTSYANSLGVSPLRGLMIITAANLMLTDAVTMAMRKQGL